MNIVAAFRAGYESVAEFERKNNLTLPEDISEMVCIEEELPTSFEGSSVLEIFQKIRASTPDAAFDNLPSDGAKNYKQYLYGWPKE